MLGKKKMVRKIPESLEILVTISARAKAVTLIVITAITVHLMVYQKASRNFWF